MKKFLLGILWLVCVPVVVQAQSSMETYNMMRAVEAAKSGDNNTAIEFLSKELDANPKNGYAHMWIAITCARSDRFGWALQYAESALKYLPKNAKEGRAQMNMLLSELYMEAEDTLKAVTYLEQIIKESPTEEYPYRKIVRFYENRHDKEAMLRYARLAVTNIPKNVSMLLLLSDALEANEQYKDALAQCEKALELTEPASNERSKVLVRRAMVRVKNKQPHEALSDLMNSTRIDIWDVSEDVLEKLNDTIPDVVRDTLLAACEQEPDKLFWKIYLYDSYRHTNEYSKVVETGFAMLPQYNSAHLIHYIASVLESYIGDVELSERMLIKQLGVDSTSAATYLNLEDLYAETGRYKEAFAMADKALSFDPSPSEKANIYQLRGRIYEIQREYEKAVEDFMAGMISDPRDYEYWFRIGKLYGMMNEPDKQAQAFDQGRKAFAAHGEELSPEAFVATGDSARAYEAAQTMIHKENSAGEQYNAACVYAQIGHPQEALVHLKKAFECGFRHFYHIAWDMDLDSLRGMKEFDKMVNEYKQRAELEKQELRSKIDTELNY